MKKVILVVLTLVMLLSFTACGKSEEVKNVESLISAIGTVSAESGDAIAAADDALAALSAEDQGNVGNTAKLQKAHDTYNQILADETIGLINEIGDVDGNSQADIYAARTSYDALSDDQKALVTNYDVLESAEAAYAEIYQDIPYDQELVIIDDQYVTVSVVSKICDKTMLENSNPPFFTMGFRLHIVNHTEDKYIDVNFTSFTVDGKSINTGFYGGDFVTPGSEMYSDIVFNRIVADDQKYANLTNAEELKNIDAVAQLYYNTDGGMSGMGLEKVKVHID